MKKIAFYIFLIGFTCSFQGQNSNYIFKHLSTKEGLSQNSIMTFYQDKLGRMWIGTRDGLNKYDGTKITIYRREIGDFNSISNDHILSMQEDDNDNLWIGTLNGLNCYNLKTDTFTQYFKTKDSTSLSNNTIWDIKKLADGNLWIATDNGINVYNHANDTFSRFLYQDDKIFGLRTKYIFETKDKKLYLATTSGLIEIINKTLPNLEFKTIDNSESLFIQNITEDKDGNLLLATKNSGIVTYNRKKSELKNFLAGTYLADKEINIRQIIFDSNNKLWVGGYGYLLTIDSLKNITKIKTNAYNKNALSSESIRTIYKDNNNSIWIGTFYGGVNIWNPSNNNFKKIIQNTVENNINYYVISSIVKGDDNLFLGTEGGGLNIFNNKTKTDKYLTFQNSDLKGNNIKALNFTKDGKLWIGIYNYGIQVYNPKTERFETNQLSQNLLDFLDKKSIYAITSDLKNNVWLGIFGQGVVKYNTKTKVLTNYLNTENNKAILTSSFVKTLLLDSNNNVWVGTQSGLNKIDANGNIENYFFKKDDKHGDNVLCIYEDSSKNIWVSLKSKGLYKLNKQTFIPVELTPHSSIKPSVQSILEDDNSNLWLASNLGIIKYNTITKSTIKYTKNDDVNLDMEFIGNASLKIGQSGFYFGGIFGVVYFNSNAITTNRQASKVIITDFEVRDIENNAKKNITQTTLPFTKSINLKHDEGNFNISFSSPNFINSKNNKYQFRLKGLENKWNITNTPTASYTIQKAGNYTFEVMGANSDGLWNKNITKLQISVAPAPWLTWWAILGYTILLISTIYFYISILKSKAKLKLKLDIEQLEIEKTKELNKKKIQFFTNISHDFRTPLALILGPLQQIIENYTGNRKTYNKLQVIQNNANRLLELINRFIDFRKLEHNIFNLEAAEGNIVKFLKEIFLSFVDYAKIGSYTFEFNCELEEIMVYYDRKKLERLIYNIISNAFRYTPKHGNISLNIIKQQNTVLIEVKDSGIGIKEEHLSKVFNRFFEVESKQLPHTDYSKGTGIGLSIAKDIVELHKGQINAHSEGLNKGSVFSVILPLGKEHLDSTSIITDFKYSDDISQYIIKSEEITTYKKNHLELFEQKDRPSILLVEDNIQLRKFIKELLCEHYNIIEAENGEVGFKLAKSILPDLIVSDVVMPKMTGTALCAAIKTELRTSHIPIILLTSRSSLLYKLQGLEQGADDYLSKPFDTRELKLRITNLLKNRALLREKFQLNEKFDNAITLTSSPDEALYKKAVEIVKKHLGDETFDIAFFASELGVSRTMLFTKIKAWSNFTPNEFVNHFKMKLAAQLLEQGYLNISQISYKVGFKTPRHFSKSFFKHYNVNPSEYASKYSSKNKK